jgi:BirA family transcriptional regulator, biotin operon repressor / biotin---[acetyl-CoA-carboxylase] ligase
MGRHWTDVAGGSVLCSMLFRPLLPVGRWYLISWLVALAARDACADVARVEASCKWPNDLQIGDRKIAGLLAEVVPAGGQPGLVVGIGINVAWPLAVPPDWPPSSPPDAALGRSEDDSGLTDWMAHATSLERVAGRPVEVGDVADRLLDRVAQRYASLLGSEGGARSLVAEYRRNLATIGQVVRVELVDEQFTGRALDVDDDGHLLVDTDGSVRAVAAGDIVHLR